ncbi:hypothetical protein JCM19992_16150 [Thermostilla marina]
MAYATAADLAARYDERLLADLAGDGEPAADWSQTPRISAALAGASGELRSAAAVGNRYTPEILEGLSGDDRAFLVDIVCLLALRRLASSRVATIGEETYREIARRCDDLLDRLRRGERVFAADEVRRAETPDTGGLTAIEYDRLNLIPDRCRNYYPSRASRLPFGR